LLSGVLWEDPWLGGGAGVCLVVAVVCGRGGNRDTYLAATCLTALWRAWQQQQQQQLIRWWVQALWLVKRHTRCWWATGGVRG